MVDTMAELHAQFCEWRGPLEDNAVWRAVDIAQAAVAQVIDRPPNGRRAQIVCGCTGVGKDRMIERLLKARRLPLHILDTSSEAALVKYAWRHRDARVVVVSDNAKLLSQPAMVDRLKLIIDPGRLHYETGDVLRNAKLPTPEDKALMMLAADDTREQDRIRNMGERDADIPAPEFETAFSVIWASNTNYTDPKNIPPNFRPHWNALLSRGINPRYIPDTPNDVFAYSLHLILECSMLRGLHLKLDDANAVLRTFIGQRSHLVDVSPRGVRTLARLRQSLRGTSQLDYWEREVMTSIVADQVVQPTLAALDVPLFQIPPK